EQDRSAVGHGLLDELVGTVDVGQRLLQIDNVDTVALGEDVALHLRVPAPGLMPEMHAGVEQLFHGDDGHSRTRTSSGRAHRTTVGTGRLSPRIPSIRGPGPAPPPGPTNRPHRGLRGRTAGQRVFRSYIADTLVGHRMEGN